MSKSSEPSRGEAEWIDKFRAFSKKQIVLGKLKEKC